MAFTEKHLGAVAAVVGLAICWACAKKVATAPPSQIAAIRANIPAATAPCDAGLWDHVYAGDPRRFHSPKDRLQIIQDCITVTGTIMHAKAEPDGDYHITVDLDVPFRNLLNARNQSGQHGFLVVEPVCENPVTQRDTKKEGVCLGFHQTVFMKDMIGKHVEITGAYVTDMEHGWNEIHPVTAIVPK